MVAMNACRDVESLSELFGKSRRREASAELFCAHRVFGASVLIFPQLQADDVCQVQPFCDADRHDRRVEIVIGQGLYIV